MELSILTLVIGFAFGMLFMGFVSFQFIIDEKKKVMDLRMEKSELIRDYNTLVRKYNRLVRQVNQLGDMWEFRKARDAVNTPFSQDQLNKLIRLCHPDRHGGSKLSNEVTQFLLNMRKG